MENHTDYINLDVNELNKHYLILKERYDDFKKKNMKLDMSRGKPCSEQLELSKEMLDILTSDDHLKAIDGSDCLNYGGIDGIPEAKELFSQVLELSTNEIIIGGNSSLNMMHDTLSRAMLLGVCGNLPWGKLPKVKLLCPSPGYDRHFAICELLNIEMIVVEMLQNGPDMDTVEKLVSEDDSIKGIWCVPKYSNPDGITYSDETVDRLAHMKTKAEDFRIFWDDAYTVHHLTEKPDRLKSIFAACKTAGNPDRVYMFTSTSKITFPGSGVSVLASSEENLKYIRKQISVQTIGPDKINQLRHVHFLKNIDNLGLHMEKHAAIIKPKFDLVLNKLESELGGKNIASWNKPNGGYFISLNTLDTCAKDVVNMAAEVGVTLTKAGATFPYGKDPRNRNIRIAPTFPSLKELDIAIEVLSLCVQLVSIKKIISER